MSCRHYNSSFSAFHSWGAEAIVHVPSQVTGFTMAGAGMAATDRT